MCGGSASPTSSTALFLLVVAGEGQEGDTEFLETAGFVNGRLVVLVDPGSEGAAADGCVTTVVCRSSTLGVPRAVLDESGVGSRTSASRDCFEIEVDAELGARVVGDVTFDCEAERVTDAPGGVAKFDEGALGLGPLLVEGA